MLSIFGKEETEVQRVNPACARWAPGLVLNHHSLPPLPDYHVLSSLPLPFWSHLTRTLPSGSLHFCPHSLLDSAALVAGQRRPLPTTSPSCHINKSPYLLIIQLFGNQIHAGGRFPNNQSSSRAEQWKIEGFDFELGGGFFFFKEVLY